MQMHPNPFILRLLLDAESQTLTLLIQGIQFGIRSWSSHNSQHCSSGAATSTSALFSSHCAFVHVDLRVRVEIPEG